MKVLIPIVIGLLVLGCDHPPEAQGVEESLIGAVYEGDIEAVKKHLAAGADVNFGNPLNIAIESRYENRREIVELLLAKGSDVNAKNDRGWTPAESLKRTAGAMMLVGATDEEIAANKEIAILLLQHGAKTEDDFKHWFPTQNRPTNTTESNNTPEEPDIIVTDEMMVAWHGKKTELDFEGNHVKGHHLTNIPKYLEKLPILEVLNFRDNKLTNVKGLENLTQLKKLNFRNNKLTDVTGLENLTQLTHLDLWDNQLTNVKGLEKLTQLSVLNLGLNRLTDVKGLEKLTKLKRLYLKDNPDLPKAQIDQLQKGLPNCKIFSNPTK